MKRILTLALSAALVLGATFAVQAQKYDHSFHGKGAHTAFLAKALNLTADQQTAVAKLHQDLMAKAQPLMQQHHQQMAEIKSLMDGVNPDAAEIGQKTMAAHSTMQQLKSLHDDFKTQLTALLTPDQKTKLQQMEQARQGHAPFGGPDTASPEF